MEEQARESEISEANESLMKAQQTAQNAEKLLDRYQEKVKK